MYVKVEPSGCEVRKGMVKILFRFYLELGDYGYEKHYVQVPERDLTEAERADLKLAKKVKRVWQNCPFHNHKIYIEPNTTDEEIIQLGKALLLEAYAKWVSGITPNIENKPHTPPVITSARIEACEAKVKHLKETPLEQKV